jgi:hypothetical protein
MSAMTLRRALATSLLGGILAIGPLALEATAQQPSDPNGCNGQCGNGGGGGSGGQGDVDVLGTSFTKSLGKGGVGGSSMPKTGGDSDLYLLVGASAAAGALTLRRSLRHAARPT